MEKLRYVCVIEKNQRTNNESDVHQNYLGTRIQSTLVTTDEMIPRFMSVIS